MGKKQPTRYSVPVTCEVLVDQEIRLKKAFGKEFDRALGRLSKMSVLFGKGLTVKHFVGLFDSETVLVRKHSEELIGIALFIRVAHQVASGRLKSIQIAPA